jgi:hypothetical protein
MKRPDDVAKQTRRMIVLATPVVRSALHDRRTRQAVQGTVASLYGRKATKTLARANELAQPVAKWVEQARRDERRRRMRLGTGRIAIALVAAGALYTWRLLSRSRSPVEHHENRSGGQPSTVGQMSGKGAEAS